MFREEEILKQLLFQQELSEDNAARRKRGVDEI